MEAWKQRRLDDVEVVYLWVDGVYLKAGLEDRKAAVLVALQCGHRESTASWASVLRDLRSRGLRAPRLVIGDGHLGIWGGLREIYPEAAEQRCWNHRMLNMLDRIGKKDQPPAKELLRKIVYADTVQQAEREKATFQRWCRAHAYGDAAELIDQDWDRMTAFYAFPQEHWTHLRTTNPVESPFAALRLRTDAAKRFKKVENATAVIWKMLLIAQSRFRRLNAPELMKELFEGAVYINGVRQANQPDGLAA